jgi:PPM family protein phosphatase
MNRLSSGHAEGSKSAALTVVTGTSQGARDYQEDALGHWFDPDHKRLFTVVADGAGGHGGGKEAAQASIASAARVWQQDTADRNPAELLAYWMAEAHREVNEAAAKIHRSARTVVVACLTDGHHAHWAHAGDSRLLRFHDGKLVERTRDDSVVQVLFERGEITEEEMGTHPDQSRLLQSLGGPDAPSPRHGDSKLSPGDVLVLCSDGFWEHLNRGELEQLAATPPKRRQAALDNAIDLAVRRAGPKADNTTAIMIHCGGGSAPNPLTRHWVLWALLVAAVGGVAAWGFTAFAGAPKPANAPPGGEALAPSFSGDQPTPPANESPALKQDNDSGSETLETQEIAIDPIKFPTESHE